MNNKFKALYILVFIFVTSCLQEPTPTSFDEADLVDSTNEDSIDSDTTVVGSTTTYFQMLGQSTIGTLSIDHDYNDSFLMRGNPIHQYINTASSTASKRCLVSRFSTSTENKIFVTSLKTRSSYNYVESTNEFYFQIEPNNETTNSTDCNNVNMNQAILALYPLENISYSLSGVCVSCTANLLSDQVALIQEDGSFISEISTSNMRLNIIKNSTGSTVSTDTDANACTEDTSCTTDGFDCCLQGQCVNHGAIKPGVDYSSSDYQTAAIQVSQNPNEMNNYPNYFYICPNSGGSTTGSTDSSTTTPDQETDLELIRLTELYQCLNPIEDEFSICTITTENVSTLLENVSSYTFDIPKSDITFKTLNSNLSENSITEVTLSGYTLFKDLETSIDPTVGSIGTSSDNLSEFQSFTLNSPLPSNNTEDILKIKYKIDGTCKKLSQNLAQCSKTYTQGQTSSPARSSDHPNGTIFKIPTYFDSAYNVIVKVGESNISEGTSTWTMSGANVVFNGTSFPVYNNQVVEITYFVTADVDNLTASQDLAQTEINSICSCTGSTDCNLEPVYSDPSDTTSEISTYSCSVPSTSTTNETLQKTVYISSKSAAHKFYDSNGVYYKYEDMGSKKQECAVSGGDESNCESFEYTNSDKNKPNNQDQYIGFNEIYGTISTSSGAAVPATEIEVVKGKNYDLFTDEGVYSSCSDCGTDYFSVIARIFPNSFIHAGGGYLPNMVESRRVDNQSEFNADDMKFGRACFVPATMIPWTHKLNSDVTQQRRDRLKAQHFMFANGYNKDWYGFDYGSLIGSFDGVNWFSIGNQRNITAKSNKLYIAINSYLSDETLNNSYRFTISEVTAIANSGSSVTTDLQSDGAQCQQAHLCSTDNDCLTQLGYDYSCENVGQIKTSWPQFDDNGNEIAGSLDVSIASLVGGTNGSPKRCVYRGRGSLCTPEASTVTAASSYTQTQSESLNTCSVNTFCSGLNQANFNNKIARYAKSPTSQNLQTYITDKSDTFGMGARFIGRPFKFFGSELPQTGVTAQLQNNSVLGMCVPGKNILSATNQDELNRLDPFVNKADTNFEMGQTLDTLGSNPKYLAACSATNDTGNFTYKFQDTSGSASSNLDLDDLNDHNMFAISQNMSTNAYQLSSLANSEIFNDDTTLKTQIGYDKNSCVRSAGASCFTDLDCSVNSWVSSKFKAVSNFNGEINEAEQDFWSEELVCATSKRRYPSGSIYPNPEYDATEKRCCRETDKTFTFYTQDINDSTFNAVVTVSGNEEPAIAGINQDLNDPKRYSRIHTIYDLLKGDSLKYPSLVTPNADWVGTLQIKDLTSSEYTKQYNTLHANNVRMCCSENWVREFNGGGHQFTSDKAQQFTDFKITNILKRLSWIADPSASSSPFTCTSVNADSGLCKIRHITEGSTYETKWLEYLGKFELTGIPQIFIESHLKSDGSASGYEVAVNTLQAEPGVIMPLAGDDVVGSTNGILTSIASTEDTFDVQDLGTGTRYISAASIGDTDSKLNSLNKKVFSEKSFACCMPTGVTVDSDTTNSQCCTGQVTGAGTQRRCCLNDYTDLSVYTNRYVSSEGAKFNNLEITDVDSEGYVRKEIVKQMGESMCCSGKAEYGVAISELMIPLSDATANQNLTTRRFIYDETLDSSGDNNFTRFQNGQRWNNHVYCVPQ